MRRDRLTFALMFGVPVIQLLMFGFAVSAAACFDERYRAMRDTAHRELALLRAALDGI